MAAAVAQHSLHPVSRALARAHDADTDSPTKERWVGDSINEIAGQGVSGVVTPAVATVVGGGVTIKLGSAAFCGAQPSAEDKLSVFLSDEDGWIATFSLTEDVRPQARQAAQVLEQHGVAVHMLSGDRAESVARVARLVGIARAKGGCSPSDKLEFLRVLQSQGHTVAMVGDGVNDAAALAQADVGIAMGGGTDVAMQASDLTIVNGDLRSVPDAIRLSRATLRTIRTNVFWAFAYNVAAIPLAASGRLNPMWAGLAMASSSVFVVTNSLRLRRVKLHR
jgi:cation transport ATPase